MKTTQQTSELSQAQFNEVMSVMRGMFFHQYPSTPNKLGAVHVLTNQAKGLLFKSYVEKMFNFKDRFDEVGNGIVVQGKTFEEQLTERFAVSRDLVQRYWETGGTINHFVAFSPDKQAMHRGLQAAFQMTSDLVTFLVQSSPFPVTFAGEAILIEKLRTELEFTNFFLGRFKQLESEFYQSLFQVVLEKNNLSLHHLSSEGAQENGLDDAAKSQMEERFFAFFNKAFPNGVDLKKPEAAILGFHRDFHENNFLLTGIHDYLAHINAPVEKREKLSKSMLSFFKKLGLDLKHLTHFGNGQEEEPAFDEFYGAAYLQAVKSSGQSEGQLVSINGKAMGDDWDFSVDHFEEEEEEEKSVNPDNIKAAGALDYIYELADHLGVFRITDALVLMWAQGRLELPQGSEAASKLYRYYKLRDSRLSQEERAMVYKSVLNKGEGTLLSRMVPNTDFTRLWQQLMNEVVDYIQRSERHHDLDNLVSKSGIYQATRNLQYNLTFNMVGKPLNDVHEMYAQLQECISILGNDAITSRLSGGKQKNMWSVIESISRQEFGTAPNISAFRTVAVDGNKIFKWVADFTPNAETDDIAFRSFINSAGAYILATDQLSGQMNETPSLDDDN